MKYPDKDERIMSPDDQLKEWVKGNSIHNGATPSDGECCPDFSCCHPSMLAPEKARVAFQNADEESRWDMLGMFLGGGVAEMKPEVKCHIVGDAPVTIQ